MAGWSVGALSLAGRRGSLAATMVAVAVATGTTALTSDTLRDEMREKHKLAETPRRVVVEAIVAHTPEDAVVLTGSWGLAPLIMLKTGRATVMDAVRPTRGRHEVAHMMERVGNERTA